MAFKDIHPEASDEAEALEKWLLESFRVDEASVERSRSVSVADIKALIGHGARRPRPASLPEAGSGPEWVSI